MSKAEKKSKTASEKIIAANDGAEAMESAVMQDTGLTETVSHGPTVGQTLRAAREKDGKTLERIARDLRISQDKLQYMEDDNFDRLPGRAYALGFLRTYARYLELDAEALVVQFKQGADVGENRGNMAYLSATPPRRRPARPVIMLSALLVVGIYGVWALSGQDSSSLPPQDMSPPAAETESITETTPESVTFSGALTEAETEVEAESETVSSLTLDVSNGPVTDGAEGAAEAEGPEAMTAMNAADETAAESDTTTSEDTSSTESADTDDAENTPTEAATESTATTENTTPAEPTTTAPAGRMSASDLQNAKQINLQARGETWMQIVDANGASLYSRIMAPGEKFSFKWKPGLFITAGNAGAVQVTVDGKGVGTLGRGGAVLQNTPFDAKRFKN